MYVLERKYLAEMTAFIGLLWFGGYPNLCKTNWAEDGESFPAGIPGMMVPSCLSSRKTMMRAIVLINAIRREMR